MRTSTHRRRFLLEQVLALVPAELDLSGITAVPGVGNPDTWYSPTKPVVPIAEVGFKMGPRLPWDIGDVDDCPIFVSFALRRDAVFLLLRASTNWGTMSLARTHGECTDMYVCG
ncbi:hypothetical protein L226DRAFT_221605 [Lentinus tigrinus ALCF2SS1-7]|uniref:uncharacterized protein n=1 Tax=Lentinus tigrinus ALCF2SS1-7 TaxID=1328758 RepID=UPI001165DE26|nr:hypothetical protein L226DRAFT_221605 [Lentinus tigrinus ALCF2SS1-7]